MLLADFLRLMSVFSSPGKSWSIMGRISSSLPKSPYVPTHKYTKCDIPSHSYLRSVLSSLPQLCLITFFALIRRFASGSGAQHECLSTQALLSARVTTFRISDTSFLAKSPFGFRRLSCTLSATLRAFSALRCVVRPRVDPCSTHARRGLKVQR